MSENATTQPDTPGAVSHGGEHDHGDAHDDIFSFVATGNALPILHEIKHALQALLAHGEETIIDLGAIPFAPGDERQLDDVLGAGEVTAIVAAMGEVQVVETRVPGVWRVDHVDEGGAFQARFIEVTFMPNILKTQREDAEAGLNDLTVRLESYAHTGQPQQGGS